MRVFVTGASGYLGNAICRMLVGAGHYVAGLTRSCSRSEALSDIGVAPIIGNLQHSENFEKIASGYDAYIHVAFDYDVQTDLANAIDLKAVDILIAAAKDSPKPCQIIYTSSAFLPGGTISNPLVEDTPWRYVSQRSPRNEQEERLLCFSSKTYRTAIVRAGMVYGGHGGTIGNLFFTGHEHGEVYCIGDGANHWAMVHQEDLARLYIKIVENNASGLFHGVDGAAPTMNEITFAIADVISRSVKVRYVDLEEAREVWGAFADTLRRDVIVKARRSQELGWRPFREDFLSNAREIYREWQVGMKKDQGSSD